MIRVFIIEPDLVLAEVYKAGFSEQGYDVCCATNAEDVVGFLDNFKPDIFVVELQIPNHNGIELLNELKSYSDLQDCPVIINSIVPKDVLGLNNSLSNSYNIKAYTYKPETTIKKLVAVLEEAVSSNESN
jgi:CheY-like chemotaxis protein